MVNSRSRKLRGQTQEAHESWVSYLNVDLRAGEARVCWLLFAVYFLLLMFQYATKAVRQSVFIDSLGTLEGELSSPTEGISFGCVTGEPPAEDTTPPMITVPSDVTQQATSPDGCGAHVRSKRNRCRRFRAHGIVPAGVWQYLPAGGHDRHLHRAR